jgi:hypothetical protein
MAAQQWTYAPPPPSPSWVVPSTSSNSSKPQTATTNSATRAPSATKSTPPPAESATSSSRARDIQCHRCKGFDHVMRDCSSKHVLVIKDDGKYSSASDFDDDHPEELISTGDADHYQSLIVQRVLSTQMEWSKISNTHCFKQSVSSKNDCVA